MPSHILRLVLPFTASLRSKVGTSPDALRHIERACRNLSLRPTDRLVFGLELHGRFDKKDGGILRRDGINIASTMIDLVCKHLRIDDSQIYDWDKLRKVHTEKTPECAVLTIRYF